jgi:2-phospho-L-lactate guanylyltransferase
MSLWALVPVKPLRRGKSRLAEILSEDERTQLNHQLYQQTIHVLKQVDEISDILVVSRDSDVLTEARDLGVRTVTENGSPELNNALRRASLFSKAFSPEGVLIVPADLPLITAQDVSGFLSQRSDAPMIVISPDRRGEGTNMLFVSPADLLTFSFGQVSFETHCRLAEGRGAQVRVFHNERIALDLDIPEDYELLKRMDALKV